MLGRMGKAKQAAKKMAMEARERKEKEARERVLLRMVTIIMPRADDQRHKQ